MCHFVWCKQLLLLVDLLLLFTSDTCLLLKFVLPATDSYGTRRATHSSNSESSRPLNASTGVPQVLPPPPLIPITAVALTPAAVQPAPPPPPPPPPCVKIILDQPQQKGLTEFKKARSLLDASEADKDIIKLVETAQQK